MRAGEEEQDRQGEKSEREEERDKGLELAGWAKTEDSSRQEVAGKAEEQTRKR